MEDILHDYNKYRNEKCGRHGYTSWKEEIVLPDSKQYGEFLMSKKGRRKKS